MITEKRKIKSQFLSLFTIPNILLVSIVILGFALRVGRINSFENEYYSAASISVLNLIFTPLVVRTLLIVFL